MAAERTWLAWWRTALAATAGALAVGRLAPEVLDVAPWPYVVLGCGYAVLAAGMLLQGARRQRELERAVVGERARPAPRSGWWRCSPCAALLVALTTVVLVVAQT